MCHALGGRGLDIATGAGHTAYAFAPHVAILWFAALAAGTASASIDVGIAAVKGLYAGKVRLENLEPPRHYRVVVDGKGKQGFVKGSGTLDLEAEAAAATLLRYQGDAQIGRPLASVGGHDNGRRRSGHIPLTRAWHSIVLRLRDRW